MSDFVCLVLMLHFFGALKRMGHSPGSHYAIVIDCVCTGSLPSYTGYSDFVCVCALKQTEDKICYSFAPFSTCFTSLQSVYYFFTLAMFFNYAHKEISLLQKEK